MIVAAAATVAGCSSSAKHRQLTLQEMIAADPLPLAKGAKWTYAVTATRTDVATQKEITSTSTWTTEVLDAREANGIVAYRVKGWPSDLAGMNDNGGAAPVATERTILRSGNRIIFGGPGDFAQMPTLDGAEGWFTWPVIDGQKLCSSAEVVYCWKVLAIDSGYRLTYYTGPDEQAFDLEPGTGIGRYFYAHHGPTDQVEAKLTSYSKPKH